MPRYIQHKYTETNNKYINNNSEIYLLEKEVLGKITIPMYFYNVIVPQLGDYYDLYPVDFDSKPVVCCPLHDEDTPSCRYYIDTNSFYCFGCRRGGSIINLHMYFAEKMNGTKPSKDEAIVFLHNYFIKNNDSLGFINQTSIFKEDLNTDVDIVKYNVYSNNLEKSITFDKYLHNDIKEELWELLDNLDGLIDNGMIKATEAELLLKKKVKELITPENYYNKIKPKHR